MNKFKVFCYMVGQLVTKVMEKSIDLVFWLSLFVVSIVYAFIAKVIDLMRTEPRLIGVLVYVVLGLWIGSSLTSKVM